MLLQEEKAAMALNEQRRTIDDQNFCIVLSLRYVEILIQQSTVSNLLLLSENLSLSNRGN